MIMGLKNLQSDLVDEKAKFSMTTTGRSPNSTYFVNNDITVEIRGLLPDAIQKRIDELEEQFKNL